jgi:hypothetical protein
LLFPNDPNVLAIATDEALETALPQFGLDDVDGIARFVSRFAKRGGPTPKGATQEESCKW